LKLPQWLASPADATPIQRHNYRCTYVEGFGVGLALSSAAYRSVFLTRLGATSTQVGLLVAMPGIGGLLLSIVAGRILQRQRRIVPWFAALRVLQLSGYTLTGLVVFLVPRDLAVQAILLVWALASIPQTFMGVAFSVVMNQVAGPKGRFGLMSRRWSIIGITQSVMIAAAGWVLDKTAFPVNYQVMFIVLSMGGLLAGYMGSRIELPAAEVPSRRAEGSLRDRLREMIRLVRGNSAFLGFLGKRAVYTVAAMLAVPILPLYYVRTVHASNSWIGIFGTVQTAVMLIGYHFWAMMSRKRGSRFVLIASLLGMCFYPMLVGLTRLEPLIALTAAWVGLFQSGLNLVFFDELMKTVPAEYAPTFVSVNQTVLNAAVIVGPMVGTLLGDQIGLSGALIASTGLRLIAFGLFVFARPKAREAAGSGGAPLRAA